MGRPRAGCLPPPGGCRAVGRVVTLAPPGSLQVQAEATRRRSPKAIPALRRRPARSTSATSPGRRLPRRNYGHDGVRGWRVGVHRHSSALGVATCAASPEAPGTVTAGRHVDELFRGQQARHRGEDQAGHRRPLAAGRCGGGEQGDRHLTMLHYSTAPITSRRLHRLPTKPFCHLPGIARSGMRWASAPHRLASAGPCDSASCGAGPRLAD